jgi:GTP-binding protein EngB required for normal cell division
VRLLRRSAKADLPERLDALAAAAEDASGRLPADVVEKARTVVTRAGHRRRLSAAHTVVALAGATGSGKSSLFNAVTRLDLARVGVRRPTTSEPLACIWGTQGAAPLLDWLSVPRGHQVPKESLLDSGEADALDGLVLLDLPDHDSTDKSHRKQVDRLVEMVDLFVWVLDPQKYADAALHDRYLKRLAGHGAVTVVVLNQIDKLAPGDVQVCVDDLRRLLTKDGFDKVPIVPMSAVTGEGVAEFVDLLRDAVGRRRAADDRVAADVSDAATDLLDATGRGEPAGVSDADRKRLVDGLAEAAGVAIVAEAAGGSYRRRARAATGWPITRWLARLRPDPLRRLRVTKKDIDPKLVRTSLPAPTPVQRARAESAVRAFGDAAAKGGPAPWVAAIRHAAARSADRLPDALDQTVVATDIGAERRPRWWLLVGAVQWLLLAATVAGAAWLVAIAVVGWLQLPDLPAPPDVGRVPLPTLLLLGGALLGLVIGLVTRIAATTGGVRRSMAVRRKLREAVEQAAGEIVIAPVEAEVERLKSFRTAANIAKG